LNTDVVATHEQGGICEGRVAAARSVSNRTIEENWETAGRWQDAGRTTNVNALEKEMILDVEAWHRGLVTAVGKDRDVVRGGATAVGRGHRREGGECRREAKHRRENGRVEERGKTPRERERLSSQYRE
jgi:hypothetical protein